MNIRKKSFLVLFGLSLVFFAYFVFAAHVITPTSMSVGEDVSSIYNITVNNTDAGQAANITWVNVTLPSTFAFTSGTNGTTAGGSFSNTSSVLMWSNTTGYLINGTAAKYFSFNASASTPGTYGIIVTTANSSGSFSSNISVTVNDTSKPTPVSFVNYTNSSGSVLPNSYINFNVSAVDNVNVTYVRVYLYNSTALVNSTAVSVSSPFAGRFINLPNGTYFVNASANDSAGNMNWTATWNFTVHDITAPNITLTASETAQTSLTIAVAFVNEPYSGAQTCSIGTGAGVISGSGLSWTITSSELTCATEYSFDVNCSDWAGSYGARNGLFTTSACGAAASSSGGSSSGSLSYSPSAEQMTEGYQLQISKDTVVKFSVGGEKHSLKVTGVTPTSATFTISSNPITDTLNVGQTRNYDVNGDGNYYDLKVSLEKVVGSKAELVFTAINEQISDVAGTASGEEQQQEDGTQQPASAQDDASQTSSSAIWIVLGILVIVIIVVIVMVTSKKKK